MSRSKHKSCSRHEKEKCRKKSRVHRLKYEKGRNERDILEKNVKRSLWSKWLNFIRGHWCGQLKNETNSLDIYTGSLSADVFDIPIERTVTATKMEIPEQCRGSSALLNNNCVSEKTENSAKKEDGRLMQYSDSFNKAAVRKNLPSSELFFTENIDQVLGNAKCASPKLDGHGRKLMNWSESSRSIIKNTTQQSKHHIPEYSSKQNFNRISSEPICNKKTYNRREVRSGIDNLLDQLMCIKQDCYTTNCREPTEKRRVKFDTEGSMGVGQKEFLPPKLSRQVSPAILVNIKPFKNHVSQNDIQHNQELNQVNLNQTKENRGFEEKVGSQQMGIEKQSVNPQLCYTALNNQVLTMKNIWDTGKEKTVLPKKTPAENPVERSSLMKELRFVVGANRSCNKVYGESGEKNIDVRDHNFVFKKNMKQFRKTINTEAIKGEEKETELNEMESEVNEKESEVDEKESEVNEKESEVNEKESEVNEKEFEVNEKELEVNEKESENELEKNTRWEKLEVESILTLFTTSGVMLGIYYNLMTGYSIIRAVFVREEIHTVIVSQTILEINQFHESCFKTIIQKRFSEVTKQFLVREIREIPVDKLKTARILHELKYCLRNVKGVARVIFSPKRTASDIFFVTRECSPPKKLEQIESQDNITDLLSFLQEYSKLVEKSCSGDDLIDIEKILTNVARTYIEIDGESDGSSINTNVLMEDLAKDHRVVQILNSSALEYLALIYHSLRPKNCSGKSFSEADLYKRRRQAIALSSELNIMKDIDSRVFRQRAFTPNSCADISQNPCCEMESASEEGDEAVNEAGLGTGNVLHFKAKDPLPYKKMMFKSNSFPGEISMVRYYRSQRARLFKDFHKDLEKIIQSTEEGLDISKGGKLEPEKSVKTENDSGKISKFQKYLVSEQLKNGNENGGKKIFFIEKNAGELKKEVIAAFNTIKDLTEEKDNAKTSVVIMLSRK